MRLALTLPPEGMDTCCGETLTAKLLGELGTCAASFNRPENPFWLFNLTLYVPEDPGLMFKSVGLFEMLIPGLLLGWCGTANWTIP